jgi:hypothetical protein
MTEQEANFSVRRAEVEEENQREKGKNFKKLKAEVLIKKFKEVFSDTITKERYFRGEKMDIHLRPFVTGVRRCATSKRIPLHLQEGEGGRLQTLGGGVEAVAGGPAPRHCHRVTPQRTTPGREANYLC